MKVKNDHRSKFSNLSNWKEEAWKNQGFNGISYFQLLFQASSFQLLKLEIYCDDHSSLSSTTAVQKWIISYTLHIRQDGSKNSNEITKWSFESDDFDENGEIGVNLVYLTNMANIRQSLSYKSNEMANGLHRV